MSRSDQIDIVRRLIATGISKDLVEVLEQQFPELAESEDERMRKAALAGIEYLEREIGWDVIDGIDILDVKEYLEKQKEQKPKVECDMAQPVEQDGTAEPDYGIRGNSVPGKLAAALRRHGWYLGHVGENQQMVEARKEEVMRNWPADRYSLTQERNLIMANSPQLEEQKPSEWSEDERIRKELIGHCKDLVRINKDDKVMLSIYEPWLAYLEKQKEHLMELLEPDKNVKKIIEDVIRIYGKTQGEWVGGYDIDTLIVNLRRAFEQKEQKSIEDVVKDITKNKESAIKFLKSAGIMDENGELAEMYRSEQKTAEYEKPL